MLTVQKISQNYSQNTNFKSGSTLVKQVRPLSLKTTEQKLKSKSFKSIIVKVADVLLNNPFFKLLDEMTGVYRNI